MVAMHSLVLALSLVGQMGSGVFDGSYDVPSTLYLSNGFTGSNGVTMSFSPNGQWTGSDGASDYNLIACLRQDPATKQLFVTCWLVSVAPIAGDNSGTVGLYPAPGGSWGLQGNGFTIHP